MNTDGRRSARSTDDPLGDHGRTTLMVVPPEGVCRAADVYRRECHPAAFERLPAHMTVIYPFAPREAWPDVLPELERVARRTAALDIRLTRWDGGPGGFAWVPDDPAPFMSLREQFMNATPEEFRPRHEFRPHLTIGWSRDGSLAEAWARVKTDPVDQPFVLDHVWLCAGGSGGYWELVHRLDLGGEQ